MKTETGHHFMIKEIKKIKNSTVDFKNLEDYNLSIQLSLDGFSFCIHNLTDNNMVVFGSYQFENENNSPYKHLELVEQLYEQEELLNLKFKNVSVCHFNDLVTQVPKPFFKKEDLASYLQYTVKVIENDFITFDEVRNTDIVNVYIPFVNINNFLLEKYGTFTYKHSATILIEKLITQYKNNKEALLFVNVTNQYFEVVILNNSKLELYNCFSFTTKEDFIYYILFVAEQLNMNPEVFKLILMGDIEKESELYEITYQYIRNVHFYTPNSAVSVLNDIPSHAHFTLLNQF